VAVSKSMFPLGSAYKHISSMKVRFEKLQGQLATGERAANLAEMGSDRFFALSMRAKLSRLDGFKETMKTVNLRLEVLDQTVSRLSEIESTQRTSVTPGAYGTGNINFSTVPALAYARFDEVMTLLNADLGGRYLFSGGKTDVKPVVGGDVAMNGEAGRDGFKTIAGERRQADIGASGLGRVTIDNSVAGTVTLDEDGNHPFGFKLSTLSTSSADITLVQPTGTPPDTLSVQFSATPPLAGETVTIGLTLPDGTEEAIILTATNSATPAPGEFQIGGSATTTAANFAAALDDALTDAAGTKLAAASTYAAAENFFNGQGDAVMRVDGPPFDTATSLIAGTMSNTVFWYKGEDSANPRNTVNAKVDEGTTVAYGVQANESGLVRLVQTLAAMAATIYPSSDTTSPGRFDAMASRQIDRLSINNTNSQGSVGVISVELSLAQTTMDYALDRQESHRMQLDGMLADIETIPPEEVSVEILALKTRLEASFEATSLVAQLSLVHYLR
jgi:flagellar hook-associated protein 3 FlgL